MSMETLRNPFPSDSFAELASAEGQHWWFKARNKILLWVLRSKVSPFKDYLEVGCGTGFVLEGVRKNYPEANLKGSEYFDEGLTFARKRIPDAKFERLDAVLMSEQDCYDVIGAFDVIEHIERDDLVLRNLARALRVGGSVVITVPQHKWLWSKVDEQACHVRRYVRSDLVEKINDAGLNVQYVTSFVSFLIPLMWLSRMRVKKVDYEPKSELHISKGLNCFLEAVMTVEIFLLKLGIRFPFGGSLLLVARKDITGKSDVGCHEV